MKAESWRQIPGYEDVYDASSLGRVRRVGGRVMKDSPYRNGYRKVQLWKNGQWKNFGVHQVVALAFIGLCELEQVVNHKNGQKADNRPENLEYVTRAGNNAHAYATGLKKPRTDHLVAARRKLRLRILCACGCGERLETPDRKGRDRRFIFGHQTRRTF